MKKMKNIILPLFLAFLSVVLVACSANKDNGTYLYEPTKEEISKLVTGSGLSKENFVSLLGDDFKLSLSALPKERSTDKSICRTYMFHDRNFILTSINGKFDCILN